MEATFSGRQALLFELNYFRKTLSGEGKVAGGRKGGDIQ